MTKTNRQLYLCLALMFIITGCKKYLEQKPSSSLTIPTKLEEFQNLLDNTDIMNITNPLPELSSDDFYVLNNTRYLALRTLTEKNAYIWAKDVYGGELRFQGWNGLYSSIFYANNVLDGLDKMSDAAKNQALWRQLYGAALFHRAFAHYDLVRNYAQAFDPQKANQLPGVPIRLTSGIDVYEKRATMEATYNQIFSDLNRAIPLLNVSVSSSFQNRPSRPAAYALLSRIYLDMGDYRQAGNYADSTLTLHNKLIDYNTISKTSTSPFGNNGVETLFWSNQANVYRLTFPGLPVTTASAVIDSTLMSKYESNDLRLPIFFLKSGNTYFIKRGYSTGYAFTGLATDEIYLIKAESNIRQGKLPIGLDALNTLMKNRYSGPFLPFSTTDQALALAKVLLERRKELIWRSLRWFDLKRYNRDGANITVNRNLNGVNYSLAPDDPRYVFPIPDDEVNLSGLQQNIR